MSKRFPDLALRPMAALTAIVLIAAMAAPAMAQQEGTLDGVGDPNAPQALQSGNDPNVAGRSRDGNNNGQPQALGLNRGGGGSRNWSLGVFATNTKTGVRVTGTVPGSPADHEGFERGDIIIAVGGFQVGHVDGQLFALGDELQKRVSRNGRVSLLVQNVRNKQLTELNVQLAR